MYMISHEAIADNRSIPFVRVSLQEVKINSAVFRAEEYISSIIASLDNVMRESRSNCPGHSRHEKVYIKNPLSSRIRDMPICTHSGEVAQLFLAQR